MCNLALAGLFRFGVLEDFADLGGHAFGGLTGTEVVADRVTFVIKMVTYVRLMVYGKITTNIIVISAIWSSPPRQVLHALLLGVPAFARLGQCVE